MIEDMFINMTDEVRLKRMSKYEKIYYKVTASLFEI